jgi:hypothetical protein
MKQICPKCKKALRDGDRVRALVLSIYREISSAVSYAIEKPYECISLEHVNCADPQGEPSDAS